MLMKIVIFAVLLVGGLSNHYKSEIRPGHVPVTPHLDSNSRHPSAGDCTHNTTNHDKSNTGTINNYAVDTNPNTIPSLSYPRNAIGFLDPHEINLADQCFPSPKCKPLAKYRTIDGSCNNLMHPVWGKSNTANTPIIAAQYSDGINKLRKAVSGRELPNVRHIRKMIFKDKNRPTLKNNLLVMQFSQTIAHDTQLAVDKTNRDGSAIQCCNPDGSTPDILPNGCLSIPIPPEELVISKKQCFSVPRNADTLDLGCKITPVRQQLAVTSFLDASLLYGSDNNVTNNLRSFIDGKLRTQIGPNGRSFLPNTKNPISFCNVPNDNSVCYVSGDPRVNQHPDIAVQTISLLRLHNYLCDELKLLNPFWNDEKLYQEARRLLIGMYQHVIYNEFVPVLLGKDFARRNQLLPQQSGYNFKYSTILNPTTISSFSSVVFRSLHSYIQGVVELFNENRQVTSNFRLSDYFFKPDIVQKNDNYDSFTRGMLTQHAQGFDKFFTVEVSERLFQYPITTKKDLISLDLARGRDYGEPSYNYFRQLCGLNKSKNFNDLSDQINKENIDALASVYENVNDIDFYAAGVFENQKPGAIIGHTFQCIMGEMFYRWKYGDRFFYEFPNQPGSFSLEQLNEIRKTTLALILCLTSDIYKVQRDAFNVPSNTNPLVPCQSILKLNFAPWKDA